ncbi:hypothetical protein D9X30_0581 [Cupriavidus sp. U2]|nr:hypothetical protein D9X30_0581 [Cupriavidus sp. U2]
MGDVFEFWPQLRRGAEQAEDESETRSIRLENLPNVDYGKPASVQCRRAAQRMDLNSPI